MEVRFTFYSVSIIYLIVNYFQDSGLSLLLEVEAIKKVFRIYRLLFGSFYNIIHILSEIISLIWISDQDLANRNSLERISRGIRILDSLYNILDINSFAFSMFRILIQVYLSNNNCFRVDIRGISIIVLFRIWVCWT